MLDPAFGNKSTTRIQHLNAVPPTQMLDPPFGCWIHRPQMRYCGFKCGPSIQKLDWKIWGSVARACTASALASSGASSSKWRSQPLSCLVNSFCSPVSVDREAPRAVEDHRLATVNRGQNAHQRGLHCRAPGLEPLRLSSRAARAPRLDHFQHRLPRSTSTRSCKHGPSGHPGGLGSLERPGGSSGPPSRRPPNPLGTRWTGRCGPCARSLLYLALVLFPFSFCLPRASTAR